MPAVPDHATPSDPRHKLYTVSPALEVSLLTGLVKLGRIYENIFLNL